MAYVVSTERRETRPRSRAENKAKANLEHSTVDRIECDNTKRRKRLERDPAKWLKHYLAEAYPRPFDKPHIAIINGAITASETGGRFCVAAPRGIGKSTVLWGVVLMLALSGRQPFPVCVPWAAAALKRAFRFWKTALCFNEVIYADYPEICAPFRHSRGSSQRLAHTIWRDTQQPTGAGLAVGEGIIVFPDNRGCIGGATINGNPRGLNHPMPDGRVLRPTLAMLDDVQDRGTAKSMLQIRDTIEVIDGDVAGMGEAGTNLPMLMSGNCIQVHDVMAYYLDSSRWKSIRVPSIESWPDGWEDGTGEIFELWQTWFDLQQSGGKAAAYYRKHKKDMTRGMVLTSPGTFRKEKGVPDAFCAVMVNYFKMGHDAFQAEAQQKPVDPIAETTPYTLTPQMIQDRADRKRMALSVPDWVTRIFASSDINPSYAFSTVILGFGEDQRSAVLLYSLYKLDLDVKNITPAEYARSLYPELVSHGKSLAGAPFRIEAWAVDAGGAQFDAIAPYSDRISDAVGMPVMGFTGRDSKRYRPWGQSAVRSQVREQCHGCMSIKGGTRIRWVAWNTDHWGEVAQRAWTGAEGGPGTVSLYAGTHTEFAQQICTQKLTGKGEIGGAMHWNWVKLPGKNDFHDAMAQCYALAAYEGIGTGGAMPAKKKARVVIRRPGK